MSSSTPVPDLPSAAGDVAAELVRWLELPLRRAADVAEDGRGLWARRPPVPRLPLRASRPPGDARGTLEAQAARRARLHGGAARRRHQQPVADAHVGGRALVRAVPRTQRQGQGRRARRGARRRSWRRRCRSRSRSRPPSASRTPTCAPARSASPGFSPAMPRCSPCSTARACAFPRRSALRARTFPRPDVAMPSR